MLVLHGEACHGVASACAFSGASEGSVQFSGESRTRALDGQLTWMYLRGEAPLRGQVLTARQLPRGMTPNEVPLPLPVLLLGSGLLALGAMRRRDRMARAASA
jgi:hypothetical protein